MQRYILNRLLLMVPTLFGVALITFILLRAVPGDIVQLKLAGDGGNVPQSVIDQERARFGLDKPLWEQFVIWIAGVPRLDFGVSMWTGRPITSEILLRLELSLQLAVMATVIATALAVPLGILAAIHQGTWLDYLIRVFSIGGLAIPSFWLGIMLLLFLLVTIQYAPPLAFTPLWRDPAQNLSLLLVPALAVGYRYSAVVTRMTRATLLEVLREDYIRTARAKGLREIAVVSRHALRNAFLPVVTVIGLEFAFLLGGLLVTEQVFNLNGIGKLMVEAVLRRDYTMTQALMLLIAAAFIVINFAVDLLYAWLDPRVRFR